jgi:hypothetical protein
MSFTRVGYLCRHIFCVMHLKNVKKIPDRYIAKRWRRAILPVRVFDLSARLSSSTDQFSVLMNEVLQCVNECVDGLVGQVEGFSCFTKKIKDIKMNMVNEFPVTRSQKRRAEIIEKLLGSPLLVIYS